MSKLFWGVGLGAFVASCVLILLSISGGAEWLGLAGFSIWLFIALWALWGYASHGKGESWVTKHEAKKQAKQKAREEDEAVGLKDRR